ncbi:MAG: polysaccharide pyruvyl transferase family protein [Ruminiclostridium sp.]|nr:polysaccharide pyruvyl transferase family protein [Ruminiclostridium sp.]
MNQIYLCGHTGSKNRGCEAILRSTAGILREYGSELTHAMTFDPGYDKKLGVDKEIDLIPYPRKSFLRRMASYVVREFFHNGTWGQYYFHKDLFERLQDDALLINIGGDTYCYGAPYISYALNRMAQERKIPTIFWGCSVDEQLLTNTAMQEDVQRYSLIVARETLSYDILSRCVDASKLVLACDPAFFLETNEVPLPKGFAPGNTVGINLSPLVFSDLRNEEDMMYQNIRCLIDYILGETDMNICLVPHVYQEKDDDQDLMVLQRVKNMYLEDNRVSLVDKEYSCTELKYVISQCRFFVGARTHAMIAAYSSKTPALALSYSIKSLGIAKDIFGTYEGYAVSWKTLETPDTLRNMMKKGFFECENKLLQCYDRVLPEYTQRIKDATKRVIQEFGTT